MRIALTCGVFLVTLLLTAAVAAFGVLALAGPHGGMLPASLHFLVIAAAWLLVFIVPLLTARWVWRRTARQGQAARLQ